MRRNKTIITVDYETWQPVPDGKVIHWENDILIPTEKLMDACDDSGAKITFFIEMCEVFWLEENDHDTYERIEKQMEEIVRRGHDVQLHMHPNWMPELGAKKTGEGYEWNWDYIHCDAVPGDLSGLVRRCKERLEEIARRVKPDYKCVAFRAGGYRVQPFSRIYDALIDNGITIDTSVYMGGKSEDRGYNFGQCESRNNPYIASKIDPSIKASSSSGLYELPIACYKPGKRIFIDNEESSYVAKRLFSMSSSCFVQEKNFFTLIGHTKANHDFDALSSQITIWGSVPGTEFVTISECADEIMEYAKRPITEEKSVKEVGEIIREVYKRIQPEEDDQYLSWCGDILLHKKALCYGYVWIVITILKMYGYNVHWITAFANDMPKGRGAHKTDTHELIRLRLDGKDYIVCPTSKRILCGSMHRFIKKPAAADSGFWGDKNPDKRFIERNYANYITAFFFSRLTYYEETGVPDIPVFEGRRAYLKQKLRSLFFIRLPGMIRHYR